MLVATIWAAMLTTNRCATMISFDQGEVTEWLKVTVLKTVVPAMVPRVRIPASPP